MQYINAKITKGGFLLCTSQQKES